MHIESNARDIILTDRRFRLKLQKYVNKKESSISRPVKDLWEEQAKLITIKTAKRAIDTGKIPSDWKDGWSESIREFVRDEITTAWIKGISEAGDEVAKKVNLIRRKDFDFNTTMTSVKGWVDSHGGKLIVDLMAAQMASAHALLQAQIALGVTSPYLLAQRIRPMVGLTEREALAVVRFMATLTEEGLAADIINNQVARYAKVLHKNRAARIARTEISNAFNFGHLDSLSQASKGNWLPGTPEKDWIAGGADPCEICLDNEAQGFLALGAVFISGDQHPTAHPHCECSLGTRIRR